MSTRADRLSTLISVQSFIITALSSVYTMATTVIPVKQRAQPKVLCLFDVDGTLTPARQVASPEMLQLLSRLREKVVTGFVGGSDLRKQQEQLGSATHNVVDMFDYAFAENGLIAYYMSKPLSSLAFIDWIGEEAYQRLANFILRYIADLQIPIKRGTFIEFRRGMINVSPIGRNATIQERDDFQAYDQVHHIRRDFVRALKAEFPDLSLTYSIGGQISFDVFPNGWDKTYCLQHINEQDFEAIHFFGDKTYEGGNDYEIYEHPLTVGHSVESPADTMRILQDLFSL